MLTPPKSQLAITCICDDGWLSRDGYPGAARFEPAPHELLRAPTAEAHGQTVSFIFHSFTRVLFFWLLLPSTLCVLLLQIFQVVRTDFREFSISDLVIFKT